MTAPFTPTPTAQAGAVEITHSDFRAASAVDPEVHAEFLALKRGEAERARFHALRAESCRGIGDFLPEPPYRPLNDAALMAEAEAAVARRRQWRMSPAGQVCLAIRDLEEIDLGVVGNAKVSQARRLQSTRGFDEAREELAAVFADLRATLSAAREKAADAWLLVA